MMTYVLIMIGSSKTSKQYAWISSVYAGKIGLFYTWSVKVAERPYSVQHNTSAQHRPPSKRMVGSKNASKIQGYCSEVYRVVPNRTVPLNENEAFVCFMFLQSDLSWSPLTVVAYLRTRATFWNKMLHFSDFCQANISTFQLFALLFRYMDLLYSPISQRDGVFVMLDPKCFLQLISINTWCHSRQSDEEHLS